MPARLHAHPSRRPSRGTDCLGEPAEAAQVAEVAMALFELPPEGDVLSCVADGLQKICGPDALVFVSSCDPSGARFSPRQMRGAGAVMDRISALLGKSLLELEADFPAAIRPAIATGKLVRVDGGPGELARGAVPAAVVRRVIARLGLEDAYVIGLAKRGEVLGAVTIVTRDGRWKPAAAAIETVVRLGAIAVERQAHAAALRLSEERQRMSLEATREALWDRNLATGEVFYSPAYWLMLGYSPAEQPAEVDTWRSRIHPEDRDATLRAIEACIASEADGFAVEFRMKARDGAWRWIQGRGKVVARDEEGRALRVVGAHADITGRKEAELALAESAERFDRWMKASFVGVIVIDAACHLVTCNDALLGMLGYVRDDVDRGLVDVSRLAAPASRAACDRARDDALKSGAWAPTELRLVRKDGTAVLVLIGGATLATDPRSLILFVVDLTERERLQAQLVKAQRMETLATFAGGIAHDFNNLLTAIRGTAAQIEERVGGRVDVQAELRDLEALVDQGAGLTRQLLGFAGRGKYAPQPLSPSALMAGAAGLFSRTHRDLVVRLRFEAADAVVLADPTQIEQVLLNLLVNAADAMPGGGELTLGTREVDLGEDATRPHGLGPGRYVELSVADRGVGMDAAVRARLFEPFFTTKAAGRGPGSAWRPCTASSRATGASSRSTASRAPAPRSACSCPRAISGSPRPGRPSRRADRARPSCSSRTRKWSRA